METSADFHYARVYFARYFFCSRNWHPMAHRKYKAYRSAQGDFFIIQISSLTSDARGFQYYFLYHTSYLFPSICPLSPWNSLISDISQEHDLKIMIWQWQTLPIWKLSTVVVLHTGGHSEAVWTCALNINESLQLGTMLMLHQVEFKESVARPLHFQNLTYLVEWS